MSSLVSLGVLLAPALFLKWLASGRRYNDEPDVLYPLSVFFGVGMWLVIRRYQHIRDRAQPFKVRVPDQADPSWTSMVVPYPPSLQAHKRTPDFAPPITPQGRELITCFDPASGYHIETVVADDAPEITMKIAKAAAAQKAWKETTLAQRRRVIRSLKKWLVDNQETCARIACRDTGKTMIDAALGEILTTCSKADWIISHGERALRPESRYSTLMLCYKKSQVLYEPLGVVAAIVSWNYPLHNALSPIMASLFAGNAIVLKCSEQVIWSTKWYVKAMRECLRVCGHDPELVQLVCCYPEQAKALTESPMIKHITFIGSERVGREIARSATVHLTPVTLELGGKDPVIIMEGTNLNKYISTWMRGIFQNAGQNCIGIERLIVHHTLHDELYAMLTERVQKLRSGSVLARSQEGYVTTVDTGAMISSDRFHDLERIISVAEEGGARVEVGGKAYQHPYHESGCYFSPTVVGDADPGSEIAQTELFAPVATLLQYDTIEEAVEIANGTRYALGASVFGMDQDACIKVAKQLECGMVSVNDFGVFYLNQDLPFGGVKASGYGRFGGPEGLRALTNPKAIVTDRLPWLIQTSIPAVLDYPVRSLVQSWEFLSGLVAMMYAETWRARFNGLGKIMSASSVSRPPTSEVF